LCNGTTVCDLVLEIFPFGWFVAHLLIARFESSMFHQGFALRIGQGTLGTVRKVSRGGGDSMGQYQKPCREAGEEIVSEEYGRQIRTCWLVVQPQGHQRHGLDDSKAILEAPTKKV
jgi:hypothetical protein